MTTTEYLSLSMHVLSQFDPVPYTLFCLVKLNRMALPVLLFQRVESDAPGVRLSIITTDNFYLVRDSVEELVSVDLVKKFLVFRQKMLLHSFRLK